MRHETREDADKRLGEELTDQDNQRLSEPGISDEEFEKRAKEIHKSHNYSLLSHDGIEGYRLGRELFK